MDAKWYMAFLFGLTQSTFTRRFGEKVLNTLQNSPHRQRVKKKRKCERFRRYPVYYDPSVARFGSREDGKSATPVRINGAHVSHLGASVLSRVEKQRKRERHAAIITQSGRKLSFFGIISADPRLRKRARSRGKVTRCRGSFGCLKIGNVLRRRTMPRLLRT